MKIKNWAIGIITSALLLTTIYSFTVAHTKNEIKTISNPTAINFIESDFKKAISEAKKQHKLLFIDLYATWCGPCTQLKKTSFTDKDVSTFFNNNFVNVSIDVEKGQGPDLAKLYQVTALPTLIVADSSGNIVLYTQGFLNASRLLEFGKDAVSKSK